MATTIGHKINNPLSSLTVSIKNIQDELKEIEKEVSIEEDLEIISRAVERIKSLANDLTHLKNPEMIDYSPDNKMIKLN